ncbi:MAG: F0F1 ATP synthase subunit epsilon [candidate division NC10 bacterium]|nr:F0F1 ATP synthase subunit epsilon [candidate division NC10 bacterium]
MPRTFLLEVVTPQRLVVSEEVEEVIAPGAEGYFGVQGGHLPFMTTLRFGELAYRRARGEERHLTVSWGYAEVLPTRVSVLAEAAERSEEIDTARAAEARDRALARLAKLGDSTVDFVRAQEALTRALLRLEVAGKKR